ncbi:hypothetical protein Goklo_000124, partial [Gossypium klotzschianum]|nr:hypothetical protein [Gossypium klotzschianum]
MAIPLQAYAASPHKQVFGSMVYLITSVFHFGLKKRYFFVSIPFPLHCLPIRCLKTLSYHHQILTSKTLKWQPFLTSFDPGIHPLHPRSGKHFSFYCSFHFLVCHFVL